MGASVEPGYRLVLNLIAIHSDQQQMLVDQSGSTVRLPVIQVPHPLVVRGQSITNRLAGLIEHDYDLKGQVLALSQGVDNDADKSFLVVFNVSEPGLAAKLDRRGLRWREAATLQELWAGNVSAQLQAAVNLARVHRIAEDLEDSWSSKRPRLLDLLGERMAHQGDLVGWTQFLVGDSVGVLSTAQGILVYIAAGATNHDFTANIETLRKLQNADGGWPVRRALIGHSERSITESTVYSLWALSSAGLDLQDTTIVRGIEWLERAKTKDGGWGSTLDPVRTRIYPTAFAARYLADVTGSSTAVKQAIAWLRDAQNLDGGWGVLRSAEPTGSGASTAVHTAHALHALLAAGSEPSETPAQSAIRYLQSSIHVAEGEPWPSTSEVETVDADAALDFRHFTTPWVVTALLRSGSSVGDSTIVAAVRWLLSEQHSLGYWSSSLTPGQTPIWATFDAIYALARVRSSALQRLPDLFDADSRAIELDIAWRSYFGAVDRIRAETVSPRLARMGWIYAWNALLTFLIAFLLFSQIHEISSKLSTAEKLVGSALLGLVPGFGPFVYQLILNLLDKHKSEE
jgi:hypothetical protein